MKPVSVLIPCHNNAGLIGGAIESALAQTAPVEVIVVDDGSTDASLDEIRRFAGRIKFEAHPNRGAPSARNRLLQLASGDWVQYLDGDDYLMPHKVAGQLAALGSSSGADVIFGPVTLEWREGDALHEELSVIPEPHDPWQLLARWHLPQTGGPLWRKQALLDVAGWDERQPCCQEHELYLRLLMAGKVFQYSPSGGAVYRRFSSGTLSTRNMMKVRRERLKIENRIEAHLRSIGEFTRRREWAINQARLEMARGAWVEDRDGALMIHAAITRSRPRFQPSGLAAPGLYRLVYRLAGFRTAERVASLARVVRK